MKGIPLPTVLALLSGCASTTAVLEENGAVTVKSERSILLGGVAGLMEDAHEDHLAICRAAGFSETPESAPVSSGTTLPGLERVSKSLITIKGVVGIFPAHSVRFARNCSSNGPQASQAGHALPTATRVPRRRHHGLRRQDCGPRNRTSPTTETRRPP